MLGTSLTNQPSSIPLVPQLFAMNINPEVAADAYRTRVLAPLESNLSSEQLAKIREQLAGACTIEIASFDAFAHLLSPSLSQNYDNIVFDTAPTGHTLRLLSLPRAWSTFLENNTRGASCLGPHSGLTIHKRDFEEALHSLTDPSQSLVALVSKPDAASLREASRTSDELKALGLVNQTLFINGLFKRSVQDDPISFALENQQKRALEAMPNCLRALPTTIIPFKSFDTVGISTLRSLFDNESVISSTLPKCSDPPQISAPLDNLIKDISKQSNGLIMVMGKGGVGKTTIASAIAIALAEQGKRVHLSTTDPAGNLPATLINNIPNLQVDRIDPHVETQRYKAKVFDSKGATLDKAGREFLKEDLESPCSEEVAVFHAFSRIVAQARDQFVVLDTAPTGHTLLLIDAADSYHHEIVRNLTETAIKHFTTPLMRLRDPLLTKIIIVTLAEQTPVTEAAQLQSDLRRTLIEPYAWVINSCLSATRTTDPLLHARCNSELAQIDRVRKEFSQNVFIVPWFPNPPMGSDLHRLIE